MTNSSFSVRAVTMTMLLASLPLQWIVFFDVGLQFKPMHIWLGILCILALVPERRVSSTVVAARSDRRLFTILYVVYLVTLLISVFRPDGEAGVTVLAKDVAYFLMFLATAVVMGRMPSETTAKTVYWGSALGVSIFVALAVHAFALHGKIFFVEFVNALGNYDESRFGIHWTIYQAAGHYDFSRELGALVNTTVSAFVLYFVGVWAYRRAADRIMSRWFARTVRWGVTAAAFLLIVGAAIRLASVALITSFLFALFVGIFLLGSKRTVQNGMVTLVVMATFAVAGLAATLGSAGNDSSLDRFSPEALEADGRWDSYRETFNAISESWIMGAGVGATVASTGHSVRVHNLILGAWYEAGIPGFLASSVLVGFFLFSWITAIGESTRKGGRWRLESIPGWVFAMPFLPLLKWMFYPPPLHMTDWCLLAMYFTTIERQRVLAMTAAARVPAPERRVPAPRPAVPVTMETT